MKLITKHDYIKSTSHIKNSLLYADSEKETDHTKVSLDYVNSREGSYGLFNIYGKMSDEEINNDYISMQNKNIHRVIFSQKEEDSKLNSYNEWKEFIEKNIDKISQAYGVSVSKIKWNAGFHDKEGQPHLHLHLWTEDNTAFIKKNDIENLRIRLIDDLYNDEIKKHQKKINPEKIEVLKKLDSFKNILKLELNESKLNDLLKTVDISSFKYQRYYQYLDKNSKEIIDKIVFVYLNDNKIFDKVIETENNLDKFMNDYYGKFDNTEKHIQKYLKPEKSDRKEIQNHLLELFKNEKIKVNTKEQQLKNFKNQKKYDTLKKINVANKILNSSLIKNESLDKEKHNSESNNYSTRKKNKLRSKNNRRNNIRY